MAALRDRLKHRQLNNWVKRNMFPSQVVRKYWSEDELKKDAARLQAYGYRLVDEEYGDANVNIAPQQNVYSSDIPSLVMANTQLARVTYERDPGFSTG